ncbi:putative transcriptional regulatory protein pdtaR [Caloramator mitchellensis]|uniref:Stage 0 sporulation protein A homolog n=1 Tax=Caloramator mitchellensis TaxID=908809 RepID=A0A0R3JSK8_CALMK|nr:response regulator [Caloramator mitchellensis]KRQ86483.1 putative transcriptional regulatory protein pdtaR [Caloramator mitchellensis]
MRKNIVIVDDEPITRMDLHELLNESGFNVIGEASDGLDAVELCRRLKPDLVLMDVKMPLLDGIKASKLIMTEELTKAVVLLTAYSSSEFVERAKESGVMAYLVKPVEEKTLINTIEIALHKGYEIQNMKNEIKIARENLEARKIIEKAKGILMTKENISEKEAYNLMRKVSMDKRCSMRKIAETILLNER